MVSEIERDGLDFSEIRLVQVFDFPPAFYEFNSLKCRRIFLRFYDEFGAHRFVG